MGQVFDGLIQDAVVVVGHAPHHISLGAARIELNRLGQIGDRLFQLVFVIVSLAAEAIGLSVVRRKFERLAQIGNRLVQLHWIAIGLVVIRLAAGGVGLGIGRVERQRLAEGGNGGVRLAAVVLLDPLLESLQRGERTLWFRRVATARRRRQQQGNDYRRGQSAAEKSGQRSHDSRPPRNPVGFRPITKSHLLIPLLIVQHGNASIPGKPGSRWSPSFYKQCRTH